MAMVMKEELLRELANKIKDSALPLSSGNLVFGKGNPDAKIMFIGEAPGEQEDLIGMPFVGAAGKQLDKHLGSIGLTIDDVYIANILKYRPPGNRNPSMEEIRAHTPFLIEQIEIIRPKVIVTLGNFSTKFILAGFDADKMTDVDGITRLRGKIRKIALRGIDFIVMPTYHPAAILYNPKLRADLEEDFVLLGKMI